MSTVSPFTRILDYLEGQLSPEERKEMEVELQKGGPIKEEFNRLKEMIAALKAQRKQEEVVRLEKIWEALKKEKPPVYLTLAEIEQNRIRQVDLDKLRQYAEEKAKVFKVD